MRKFVLASSVAVLLATVAGAGPSAQTSTNGKTAATAPATSKALSATGKIVGFDNATKTLTLSTAKGEEKVRAGVERPAAGRRKDDYSRESLGSGGLSGEGPLHGLGQQQGCRVRDGVRRRPREVEQVDTR